MVRSANLYRVSGVVSSVEPPNKAIISFSHELKLTQALLTNTQFYHEGRHIPPHRILADYLRSGVTVIFSCEESTEKKKEHTYPWIVTTCWVEDKSPLNRTLVMRGLDDVLGKIKSVGRRNGIITVFQGTEHACDVSFLASRFYVDKKRFPAGKDLITELNVNDLVHVDAIPCIFEGNKENLRWFATCVYTGRRPQIDHGGDTGPVKAHQRLENNDFRSQYIDFYNQYFHNPHTVFVEGAGTILCILDAEFGIVVVEIKKNVFLRMLFHRKQFFLFGLDLDNSDIRAVLCEEDRVKFVAVGAPPGFGIDFIAVQVVIQKGLTHENIKSHNPLYLRHNATL